MRKHLIAPICLFALLGLILVPPVRAAEPVVHAVLFYSPTCGHCHKVMTQDLPPLTEKYQDRLQIAKIDVTEPEGQQVYQEAIRFYDLPDERLGVPTLIVGDSILVGSAEIPAQFPGIIETGLLNGGIPWPQFPGLQQALDLSQPAQSTAWRVRFLQDPLANSIAVIVLLGMVGVTVESVTTIFRRKPFSLPALPVSWLPVLAVIGLAIALYLSYVEISQVAAVCGPLGDCNAVQSSPYARLFGVVPIGLLGIFGYLGIFAAWSAQRAGPAAWRYRASRFLWWLALVGVLFSIYLTFLEPFVIGATCAWCITSAIVITLILLAATPGARQTRNLS